MKHSEASPNALKWYWIDNEIWQLRMVLDRKAIISVEKKFNTDTDKRQTFLWLLSKDVFSVDFVLWFWYWGSHLLDRFFAYIGRRVTHKLISTKYLCFYWKAHILLSSQKIMLCMICNIDILNKDLHMFYIKKQRRFLSTRSSQLQHISHDFWKNSTEICFEFVVVIFTWEVFLDFLNFLHALKVTISGIMRFIL